MYIYEFRARYTFRDGINVARGGVQSRGDAGPTKRRLVSTAISVSVFMIFLSGVSRASLVCQENVTATIESLRW